MTQKSPMKKLCFDGILSSGLTGKGVRVALVDSGINPRHPHVKKISGGVHIEIDNYNTIFRSDVDIADEIGHGTACAGAPSVLSVIFGRKGLSESCSFIILSPSSSLTII